MILYNNEPDKKLSFFLTRGQSIQNIREKRVDNADFRPDNIKVNNDDGIYSKAKTVKISSSISYRNSRCADVIASFVVNINTN